jgi:hypothetical protein
MLSDAQIREQFVEKHLKRSKAVYHELAVKRGIAIADLVAINNSAHCYEIKSDVDSLNRLPSQIVNFSDVFKKVTLITTAKHAVKASAIIPDWWGVIIAKESKNNDVIFNYLRISCANPKDTSSDLLAMLWNDELKGVLDLMGIYYKKKYNRDELIAIIINNSSSKCIGRIFSDVMSKRFNQ